MGHASLLDILQPEIRVCQSGMTRFPDHTCSALYVCDFWRATELAGVSVSSSVELGNSTTGQSTSQGFCENQIRSQGKVFCK